MANLNIEYKRAYVEVLEMIKNMPIELQQQVPKEEIDILKENRDKNYFFKYDKNLPPQEQNISEKAKATLVYLYRKYIKSNA